MMLGSGEREHGGVFKAERDNDGQTGAEFTCLRHVAPPFTLGACGGLDGFDWPSHPWV